MKFVKENLVLVIVSSIVVLLLVAVFAYPLPQWRDELRGEMGKEADKARTIHQMTTAALQLPGGSPHNGVPNEQWVKAKTDSIESVTKGQKQVESMARDLNSAGRVIITNKGVTIPLLPIPTAVTLAPGTVGKQLLNPDKTPMLPVAVDKMDFKSNYQMLFRIWTNLLASPQLTISDAGPIPTTPWRLEELQKIYSDEKLVAAQNGPQPAGGIAAGGMMGAGNTAALTNRDFYTWAKGKVTNRAAGLQMFVEPSPAGFQIRDWAFRDNPPTDQQIFEGLVDCWIQADIVKAIMTVNNPALGVGADRNVSKAAIKRLTRIVIGNAARTRQLGGTTPGAQGGGIMAAPGASGTPTAIPDPGPLFFTSTNASSIGGAAGGSFMGPAVNAGGAPGQPQQTVMSTPNAINYELGMTGHSAGDDYDVVHVSILMDIDPAALNAFESALYSQNMGYVVEGEQFKTVDPTERASYGYLYGDGQVVEAEIQVEAILLRSWTAPLMPQAVRDALGAKAPETKAAGQ
ncbi:MAG TPA: hypothetical protein VHM90_18195 [Phycisphaerae bacterium]|jgi:hypothetical protein|nr:hypothetical protein [Phycisphaerae bacterium]